MKLNEKILFCRKKMGMSQETLAEHIGVSRQSISKWETGDAEPEINKLRILAKVFNVTTDWLLSIDDHDYIESKPKTSSLETNVTWIDSVPGVIGRLLRSYGWLFGVYLVVIGTGIAGMGALARLMVNAMFTEFDIFSSGDTDDSIQEVINFSTDIATNNPVSIFGTIFIFIGIVMIITGIVLAIVLKNQSKKNVN